MFVIDASVDVSLTLGCVPSLCIVVSSAGAIATRTTNVLMVTSNSLLNYRIVFMCVFKLENPLGLQFSNGGIRRAVDDTAYDLHNPLLGYHNLLI